MGPPSDLVQKISRLRKLTSPLYLVEPATKSAARPASRLRRTTSIATLIPKQGGDYHALREDPRLLQPRMLPGDEPRPMRGAPDPIDLVREPCPEGIRWLRTLRAR